MGTIKNIYKGAGLVHLKGSFKSSYFNEVIIFLTGCPGKHKESFTNGWIKQLSRICKNKVPGAPIIN